ncbi:MAG: SDR family NAD(P)-dependent oxidoreductase [bacterium]|nr:SDR family NAD(P)-dependent oxidoreductase [bacterium]
MKTILVTGCAGFIGSHVCKQLLKAGTKVAGIDNINNYYDIRLKHLRLDELKKEPDFIFEEIDIENTALLETVFKKHNISAVINLAARAGVRASMENPFVYMTTNANGTLNLLELMRKYEVQKMVLASTSSLYAGQKMPFSETLAVNTPISSYAASKKAAEVLAYSHHYLYNLDISVVRYFTVYGPAGRPDMCIFRFIKWIDEGQPVELFGDGSQARDFTYVEDIAEGTIKALKNVGYEIINLGGGKNPISINYVIGLLEKHLAKNAIINNKPFHKADIKETWADISKADKLLDWKPQIAFETGIRKTIDWYQQNKELMVKIKL